MGISGQRDTFQFTANLEPHSLLDLAYRTTPAALFLCQFSPQRNSTDTRFSNGRSRSLGRNLSGNTPKTWQLKRLPKWQPFAHHCSGSAACCCSSARPLLFDSSSQPTAAAKTTRRSAVFATLSTEIPWLLSSRQLEASRAMAWLSTFTYVE